MEKRIIIYGIETSISETEETKMKISKEQQAQLQELNTQIKNDLSNVITTVDNICKKLDSCEVSSYYTNSIRERASEAEVRAKMADIRCDEFQTEIKNGELSTDGFY